MQRGCQLQGGMHRDGEPAQVRDGAHTAGLSGDTSCQSSCSARASAKVTCTPQTVNLVLDLDASGDLAKLKTTNEANLPTILLIFKTKGQLAQRALQKVAATGQAVSSLGEIGRQGPRVRGPAAQASIKASAAMSVSVSASASVS